MEKSTKTLKLNTETTFYLFDKLKKNGKFLFLSTSEVYSGLANPPHKESEIGTTNTTHPRSCYIEAKRCGEAICNAHREKGVQSKSARLSLAYGPGTKPNDLRVINSFIQKALQGKRELLDQGEAKRTYCYKSDKTEIMETVLIPLDKWIEMIFTGEVRDSKTIAVTFLALRELGLEIKPKSR